MTHWTADDIRALGVRTDLVTAGSVFGISRNTAYELNRRGEFPCKVLRLGSQYVVPVAPLLLLLGYEADVDTGTASSRDAVTKLRRQDDVA